MSEHIQTVPPGPRRKLRLAAIGGIAAFAIAGGGITAAVASASMPEAGVAAVATTTPSTAPASGTTAPTPVPHKPHLGGTVTSVSGNTVLIKDREGFTRTIVLSSKTTYTDGLTAKLTVGTKIHAEGAVDANETSLDATSVGKDNGRHGGPGGGRPGGPRGGHGAGDGAAPPPGTKAPTAPATSAPASS